MFTRVEGLFMKKKKKRVSINKKVFPFMKRGFTLVELLAVLVILAVLVALSVPTYYVVSNQIKESSYETKLENIISHAESYAENTNNFVFDVGTLIEQGLLEADNEAGEYLDPRNGRDMRCDIINVVFENNQYVASVTESDTCYTDEELQNLFGMFEIVIYRPDGTKVEPIEGTDWIREQDIVLKYELKEEYKGYEQYITQVIWSGEQEKTCTSDFANCNYEIHTDLIKNITVNLQVNLNINTSLVISRTNKRVLIDLESPRVDNIVTGTDLNEQEMNRTEFDLSDGNGSGVKYYAVLPSTGTCSGSEYEAARKNINGNHVVEYLDSGDYKICVEDNVGNTGEGSVSLSEINFDPNGGTLEIDKKVIGTNTSYGVMPTPTREYYHFLGWFTEKEGGTQVTPDTVLTEDTTVYAHWQIYTYTVTYNPNGGSVSPTSETKEHGSEYGTMPTPTRSNHRFLGWFTSATGGTQITSTSIVTGNITLYAHWEVIGHTVTYDYSYNGGTSASKTSELVATGSKVDLSPTASKNGYSFVGWNTNANATSGLTNITMGNSDIRLYAIYRKTVTVTLVDFNGSSRRTRTVSGIAYNRNTSTSITIPALGSYTGICNGDWVSSLGWSTSTAASATVNYNGNTTYTLSSNLTLYARYQHQAIIWLDPGDGTTTSQHSATSTNQINAGNNSNGAPNMSNPGPYSYYVFDMNPTRTGHSSNKFGGWYLSQCMGDDNVSGYSRCFNNVGSLPTSEDNARKTAFTFYYKCGGFLAIRWDR